MSRCEIDMVQIKQKFSATFKDTLSNFIKVFKLVFFNLYFYKFNLIFLKGDTSGDYRKILLNLIGEDAS